MPDWLPSSLAEAVVVVPLRIAFLAIVGLLTRFALHRLIGRVVRRSIGRQTQARSRAGQVLLEATSLPVERRAQRITALGSLARNATTVAVFGIVAVMILAELGFNVTSIVAGTSLVAATLAFGLQNLIKDLIAGVFMLAEGQLGVGDWVDLEKAAGQVQEVGLRVTHLRAEDGTAWYVRNGEVVRVGNFSQGGPGALPPTEVPTD